jgi:hypothetical protein
LQVVVFIVGYPSWVIRASGDQRARLVMRPGPSRV